MRCLKPGQSSHRAPPSHKAHLTWGHSRSKTAGDHPGRSPGPQPYSLPLQAHQGVHWPASLEPHTLRCFARRGLAPHSQPVRGRWYKAPGGGGDPLSPYTALSTDREQCPPARQGSPRCLYCFFKARENLLSQEVC